MTVYSHSRLSTFENCPLRFKFNYIDKIDRDDQGIEAFMGSRVHDVMEKLYGDLKCKVYTVEELLVYYDEIWEKEFNEKILIVRKDRTAEDYKNIGEKCIEDYYKTYYPFDQGQVLGVERKIMIDLKGDGKYKVQGYIDRLMQANDGTYEIHDYKTNAYLPEQKKMDEDRQLALYQIGIGDMWNDVNEVKLIWHYVVFDKEIVSTRTQEQLDTLKEDTVKLIDKIESTVEYEAKETALCKWCSYQDICPKKKHLHKVAELPVNEYLQDSGVKLAEQYYDLDDKKKELKQEIIIIDEELDKIKEATIQFAEKEDVTVIDGSNCRLKVTIKEEPKIPTKREDPEANEAIKKILIDEGKYEEVSTVSSSFLKSSISKKIWPEDLMSKISQYIKYQVTKKVSLQKKREEK